MTFDEWWNNWSVKDWNDIESAKNLFQQAFEAGLHADVHTDNSKVIADLEEKLANADYQLEGRDVTINELKVQNRELQCCANCKHSYGGEEEPQHDCGYCHAMQCICKLKLEEHTSDIYRMWEDKCDKWEMRVN